jgi:hypothetical protein
LPIGHARAAYRLDYRLSVAAGVGFIALAGVAVEIGVVKLVYLKQALLRRLQIVPRRARGRVDADKPLAPMTWAQRLKRVFAIDIEACPHCGGTLRVIA